MYMDVLTLFISYQIDLLVFWAGQWCGKTFDLRPINQVTLLALLFDDSYSEGASECSVLLIKGET